MAVECVFGDWRFSLLDDSIAAFRPGHILPLLWDGWQVREVPAGEEIPRSVPYVALAAHWALAHTDQLTALVGPVEVARFPRITALPW